MSHIAHTCTVVYRTHPRTSPDLLFSIRQMQNALYIGHKMCRSESIPCPFSFFLIYLYVPWIINSLEKYVPPLSPFSLTQSKPSVLKQMMKLKKQRIKIFLAIMP